MENTNTRVDPLLLKEYNNLDESTISDSSVSVEVQLKPKEGMAKFFLHLKLLLFKNLLLFWRSKKITLFQLLMPILSI
jgi:hypothetical protein